MGLILPFVVSLDAVYLYDTPSSQVTLFLWRKAASEHYKELEGSLLLLWSPQVWKYGNISKLPYRPLPCRPLPKNIHTRHASCHVSSTSPP